MSLNLDKFNNRIIDTYLIESREGTYVEFPDNLHSDIKEYLFFKGIEKLYGHQAEMYEKASFGENVIITTSTASGKTLSFLLPVINKILKNPSTRAIFIYPTKALASDQYKSFLPILEYFGKDKINAGIYDGDTPAPERSRIRKEANIILTNPEMINGSFLPSHNKYGFDFIFKNLDFLVIDELHYYRGAFGSHIANIIRRLKRICKFYNSNPQFFCSTATISNPLELAENIFGSKFSLVEKDCSPRGEKEVYFWLAPLLAKEGYRIPNEQEVSTLLPELILQDKKLIAFSSSRRELEVILKEVKEKIYDEGSKNLISGYRGGYKADERKEIERKINNDIIKAVIATNALELGIDIGNIDLVLSIGFPRTKASYFQQIGRAGRKGNKSYSILMLDLSRTYDNYIYSNPQWIFNSQIENAVVDKDNLYIQLAHIRASASEIPLSLDDIKIFPNLGEILPVLIKNKEIMKANGKFIWIGKEYPAGDYSLRTISDIVFKVVNTVNNEFITELEELCAYREVHSGAIYIHDGETYLVESLNLTDRVANVKSVNFNYYTVPWVLHSVEVINTIKQEKMINYTRFFGDVKVSNQVTGFKKMQFHTHANLGFENLDLPVKSFETEGIWLNLPKEVTLYIENLSNISPDLPKLYFNGISSVLLNAFKIITMTSDNDVGAGFFYTLESQNNLVNESTFGIESIKVANIVVYDNYIGGLGFAEKGYDLIEFILRETLKLIKTCSCKNGCPACVGSNKVDKKVVTWVFNSLFEEVKAPDSVEIFDITVESRITTKPFKLHEIEENWNQFIALLNTEMRNVSMVSFLSSLVSADFKNNLVFLRSYTYIDKSLLSEDNIIEIKGLISKYFDFDYPFEIELEVLSNSNVSTLEKRFNDLTK